MSAVAMLLADSRFPAGGYAHSLGLEQAVSDGLGVDDVAGFMDARLRLVARADACLSVAARRAAAATGAGAVGAVGAAGTASTASTAGTASTASTAHTAGASARRDAALAQLDGEHAARCPSPVLREIARRLGAQLLRSAATAWPSPLIDGYRAVSSTTPRPVALGVVGAAAGLDDRAVATVALYDDAATVASAALKLLGLDPADSARWVAELAPEIDAVARAISADARPIGAQEPPAAVGLELAATTHARRTERFFAS